MRTTATTTSSPRDDGVTGARTAACAPTPEGSGTSGDSGGPGGPGGLGGPAGPRARTRWVRLPGNPQAAAAARRFVRESFADWTAQRLPGAEGLTDRLADEAVLLVSELVTNAVVYAGTTVELRCRLAPAAEPYDSADPGLDPGLDLGLDPGPGQDSLPGVVIEVSDRHPTRPIRARARAEGAAADGPASESGGRGLQLISAVAESWGITYRHAMKAVWFRLPVDAPGAGARPEPELPYDDQIEIVHGDQWEHTSDGRLEHTSDGRLEHTSGGRLEQTSGGRLLQRELRAAELLAPVPRRPTRPEPGAGRVDNGALSFLAEASDLLSGQLDADQVAALAAQLIVPRLADWCAVWLHDGDGGASGRGLEAADGQGAQRLARVWHTCESRIDSLRAALEKQSPELPGDAAPGSAPVAVPWPWPHEPGCDDLDCADPRGEHLDCADPGGEHLGCGDLGGAALACPLAVGGRRLGTLLLGRGGLPRFPDEVVGLIEDLGRRVARAVATARAYRRQERISQVLQRRLLPRGRAKVPGVESAVVYEPREGAWAGGDFWDLFDAGNGRWCFALGDVCGSGPEAAAVTGLARPVLRLLARGGFGVAEVLDRLNKTMARQAADSVAAVAAAMAAAGAGAEAPVEVREESEQARFLSLLYGEIVPYPGGSGGSGGARCTLASAGHPLPLVLGTDGAVRVVAAPQVLLGVVEDAAYVSESFDLRPGETLLCVTDGVTERRSGRRLFDDEDGLAKALAAGVGLSAKALADHLRTAVHAFDPAPPDDDLALLVLKAAGGLS
ncbi:SpoIIE family protein phosphatase [Streptomyces sp. NPDC001339]|uniref:SpoIIE family protein phosphatase n=1 Tax=Streptomyces sp. NPDC001339 TaxID=3364563 RepID=UPI003677DF5D